MAKKIVGKLLMAFLLVSVGVAVGREMAARNAPATGEAAPDGGQEKVVVYYMHGIPCVTCTFIETTARELVAEEYAEAVTAGRMEFVSLNYLAPENEPLADRYDVGSNMVIVARSRDGQEVDRVRLDKVMELAGQADELRTYLRQGIDEALRVKSP